VVSTAAAAIAAASTATATTAVAAASAWITTAALLARRSESSARRFRTADCRRRSTVPNDGRADPHRLRRRALPFELPLRHPLLLLRRRSAANRGRRIRALTIASSIDHRGRGGSRSFKATPAAILVSWRSYASAPESAIGIGRGTGRVAFEAPPASAVSVVTAGIISVAIDRS
jgi:hypothetical protein